MGRVVVVVVVVVVDVLVVGSVVVGSEKAGLLNCVLREFAELGRRF